MRLVIDIPDEEYELVRHGNKSYTTELELMNAITNGKPLPKHHGDLIERRCGNKVCNGCEHSDICDTYNAPTIIEGVIQNDKRRI